METVNTTMSEAISKQLLSPSQPQPTSVFDKRPQSATENKIDGHWSQTRDNISIGLTPDFLVLFVVD